MYVSIKSQELSARKSISNMSKAVSPQRFQEQEIYKEMQENRRISKEMKQKTRALFEALFETKSY